MAHSSTASPILSETGPSVGLTIEGLSKTYPAGPLAADNVGLELEPGQLFTLLGPSGSGKTTTLRSVAGLETPDRGRISVGDRVVFCSDAKVDVPANKRGFGMVFQSYAIWPHMTVFENAAFPLTASPRRRRLSRPVLRERVMNALTGVQLEGLADRRATKLSGGQQQRLALARALVMRPPLLLLDEPLSNLDAKLRDDMRLELKSLQQNLGVTTLYVTHDQTEALALSNRIGVMRAGRLEQVGTPKEIYLEPATRFVAEFIGSTNLVPGRVVGASGTSCEIETEGGRLVAETFDRVQTGSRVIVSLRPELVTMTNAEAAEPCDERAWQGVVTTRAYLGEAADHLVRINDRLELRVRCGPGAALGPGTSVRVHLGGARPRAFLSEAEHPSEPARPTQPVGGTSDTPH
jgi:iron(III) transport system ATP-binding protein